MGGEGISQKHISTGQKRIRVCLYAHTLCVGIFWCLKLYKEKNICLRHVDVCSLGHL